MWWYLRPFLWVFGIAAVIYGVLPYGMYITFYSELNYQLKGVFSNQIDRAILVASRDDNHPYKLSTRQCSHEDLSHNSWIKFYGECSIVFPRWIKKFCSFWWLGRRCLAIGISEDFYATDRVRERLQRGIRNPCAYGPQLRKWPEFRCWEDGRQPYDVVLVIYATPADGNRPWFGEMTKIIHFNRGAAAWEETP